MEDFWMDHRYCDKNFTLTTHYENVYQIVIILCGRVRYQVGEKEYIVSKGGIVVLNTLEYHTLEVLEYPYERYGSDWKRSFRCLSCNELPEPSLYGTNVFG